MPLFLSLCVPILSFVVAQHCRSVAQLSKASVTKEVTSQNGNRKKCELTPI